LPRPVIHIGYHKTATTWFQKAFYPRVTNLRFVPRDAVRAALLDDTAFEFDAAKARETLGVAPGEPVALCEEGLSGYLHHGGLNGYLSKEMAHRLNALFPDANVVIFIRAQPSIVAASYQQYVKGGGTHSFERYAFAGSYLKGGRAERAKAPRFTFDHFEYLPLIRHYRDLFGAERVHVFAYEAFRRDRAAFLADFTQRLGLEVDLADVPVEASKNRSYGMATLEIVRALNLFTNRTVLDKRYLLHIPGWYGLVRGIGEALNALPFGKPPSARRLLGRQGTDWIAQRYWKSNVELAALTGLDLAAYGYPLCPPEREVQRPGPPRLLRWWGN
jgi:hypothetical protein